MADIEKMAIKNFKGIESIEIDFNDRLNCPVTTLIGLNESGKTTILEALSHFVSGDKSVSSLFDGFHAQSVGAALIPLHKKAAFTGTIEIIATVTLSSADIAQAAEIVEANGLILDRQSLAVPFTVRREFKFVDSVLKPSFQIWGFRLHVKKSFKSKFKIYVRPTPEEIKAGTTDLWYTVANSFDLCMPQMSYFPTFLVDMPNKIYLAEHEGETAINQYYRLVFEDILSSLGENISLKKHVADRISSYKKKVEGGAWFASFYSGTEKGLIDSVFQKISNAITTQVLGSWQRVFQRPIAAKNILVEWQIDTAKNDVPYVSLYVTDGESRYAISERSLGFRWFFSFLLFTAFKKSKNRSTFFLFDEPAANLHAKAQAELLTSFSRIASGGNRVIYSTHSHHMINPQWLSGAYIVDNSAVDYDSADSFALSAKPTKIGLTKYREFASKYPSRSSYFQPVVEKLEYVAPLVLGESPFVLVEGISDYYALRIAQRLFKSKLPFNLMPGVGAGASGPQVSLLMGRGDKFLVLLDDDGAGKKEAARYRDNWFLSENTVFTLAAVDPKFAGLQLEGLIHSGTLELVTERFGIQGVPTKKQIGWYLAESLAMAEFDRPICEKTQESLFVVLNFLAKKIKATEV